MIRAKFLFNSLILLSLLTLHPAPAHAFFFFVFPIPKGSADPDSMDATLTQRQNAMCAAFQLNAIDPTLGGKREKTWRGEVAALAEGQVAPYARFVELRNRYIRQWQAQAKSSYEAGMSYSRMLMDSCEDAGLPQTAKQYKVWNEIKPHLREGQNAKDYKSEIEILNFEALFSPDTLRDLKIPPKIEKALVEVRVLPDGKVDYCQYNKRSGSDELDAFACSLLSSVAQFKPAISELGYTLDYKELEIDWPSLYARRTPASVTPGNAVARQPNNSVRPTSSFDPVMDAAIQRCDAIIGGSRTTVEYRLCLSRQIQLLSK